MLYKREIDNEVLIQFIILYTLDNVDKPAEYTQLLDIVLENCNINFNDFQICLDNLVDTEHVSTYLRTPNCRIYEITEKGHNFAKALNTQVPIYIREPILESIKELYLEERRRHAVQGGIVPVRGDDEFGVECKLYDDERTQILGLMLYAGGREQAEKMSKYFKKNYEKVYEKILNIMNEAQNEEDEA